MARRANTDIDMLLCVVDEEAIDTKFAAHKVHSIIPTSNVYADVEEVHMKEKERERLLVRKAVNE